MEDRTITLGFIDKGTGKHESNCVYDWGGCAPTITASFGVKQPPTMYIEVNRMELKYLGNYNREGASAYAGSVYDADGLAPTIDTMQGGGQTTSHCRGCG